LATILTLVALSWPLVGMGWSLAGQKVLSNDFIGKKLKRIRI
jgi:hypothetical protein